MKNMKNLLGLLMLLSAGYAPVLVAADDYVGADADFDETAYANYLADVAVLEGEPVQDGDFLPGVEAPVEYGMQQEDVEGARIMAPMPAPMAAPMVDKRHAASPAKHVGRVNRGSHRVGARAGTKHSVKGAAVSSKARTSAKTAKAVKNNMVRDNKMNAAAKRRQAAKQVAKHKKEASKHAKRAVALARKTQQAATKAEQARVNARVAATTAGAE